MAYMLKENVQQEYYMQPAQKSGHTEILLQFSNISKFYTYY